MAGLERQRDRAGRSPTSAPGAVKRVPIVLFACSVTFGKLLRSVVPGPHLCKNGGWARGCAGLRDCSHPPHPRLPERSARGAGVGAGGPLFGPHRSPHPERRSAPWCPGELRPTAIRGRHGEVSFPCIFRRYTLVLLLISKADFYSSDSSEWLVDISILMLKI